MGKYINKNSKGETLPAKGKAEKLIQDGAKELDGGIIGEFLEYQPNMICVVDNGLFEACGYAYNEAEFNAFNHVDGRPKRWFSYEYAEKLAE